MIENGMGVNMETPIKCEACGKTYNEAELRKLKILRWNAVDGTLRAHCTCGHILYFKEKNK
jgi:hypothetical protein